MQNTPPLPSAPSGLTPPLKVLIGMAAAVVALTGLALAADIFGPLAIAAVIVIICSPIRRPLVERGWPGWLATTVVIIASWAILIVMALMLAWAGVQFTNLVIDLSAELRSTADDALALLHGWGLDTQVSAAVSDMLTPATIIGFITEIGSGTLAVMTALFFVFAYAIFMAADAGRFSRAQQSFGASASPAVRRIAGYNASVRKYYVVNTIFGLIVAVIDGLALWWLGIPAPAVWAILAFVTNYVPNIGFVLGLIPPMILALVLGGPGLMLAVIAIYIVVNVVLQVLVQPKFVSDAVSLSLTLSFFSVLFWTFIIGPLGAILAIPLTLLLREVVFGVAPDTRWLRWLSGDNESAEAAKPHSPHASNKLVE